MCIRSAVSARPEMDGSGGSWAGFWSLIELPSVPDHKACSAEGAERATSDISHIVSGLGGGRAVTVALQILVSIENTAPYNGTMALAQAGAAWPINLSDPLGNLLRRFQISLRVVGGHRPRVMPGEGPRPDPDRIRAAPLLPRRDEAGVGARTLLCGSSPAFIASFIA